MQELLRTILALLLAATAVGCVKNADSASYQPPQDMGTQEQHAWVKSTVADIGKIAAALDDQTDFASFPIYIIGDAEGPAGAEAYCVAEPNGHGLYIAIHRRLLEQTRRLNQQGLAESRLFLTLLHEFGHCLFGRVHEMTVLKKDGFVIDLGLSTPVGSRVLPLFILPVTIMYPVIHTQDVPTSLKWYYVEEILGRSRMTTLNDLLRLSDVKLASIDSMPGPMAPLLPEEDQEVGEFGPDLVIATSPPDQRKRR